MTDLLTGNYLDELRREYARTVATLVAASGISWTPSRPLGVAANPFDPTAAGEQVFPSLPTACGGRVDSITEISL